VTGGGQPADGPERRGVPTELAGFLAAVAIHLAVVAPLSHLHRDLTPRPQTVELDVVEQPPPPPPPPPEVKEPPPPPPEPVKPRVIVRKVVIKEDPLPPPPPNQEPPPNPPDEPPPPVFGVTMDSTVTGNSAVAVPVGNTLATKDRTPGKPGPPAPAVAGPDPSAFAPAAETSIKEYPRLVSEGPREYPPEASRLGLEGLVVLRVGIDRHGAVRSVRVINKAGYGFDDAAARAMLKGRFTPALTHDGTPVDFVITYRYRFTLAR
jgi:protein TonB